MLVNKQQVYPHQSNLELVKLKPTNYKIKISQSNITIRASSLNLTITGDRNIIKIQDSAGKLIISGCQNQVQIKKSWMACQIEGVGNIFDLVDTQFQLHRNQGVHNYIPGVINDRVVRVANRAANQRRLVIDKEHLLMQFRRAVKNFWPNLIKAKYNSQDRQCPICYDDIRAGDQVTSVFCFHFFHSACIEACLQTTTKCPVCSLDFLEFIKKKVGDGSYIVRGHQLLMKESMEGEKV